MRPEETIEDLDDLIEEVRKTLLHDDVGFAKIGVLAQLYQARALNEIAQSLYEIVRDGIGMKSPDDEKNV